MQIYDVFLLSFTDMIYFSVGVSLLNEDIFQVGEGGVIIIIRADTVVSEVLIIDDSFFSVWGGCWSCWLLGIYVVHGFSLCSGL